MNWDAIIGIAEVIGVIAIVVSLMYVAAQIRQNSEIARATIVHDTSASFMNFHQMLASDGDLAGVYYRGTNSEELSEVEKVRFHAILEM